MARLMFNKDVTAYTLGTPFGLRSEARPRKSGYLIFAAIYFFTSINQNQKLY